MGEATDWRIQSRRRCSRRGMKVQWQVAVLANWCQEEQFTGADAATNDGAVGTVALHAAAKYLMRGGNPTVGLLVDPCKGHYIRVAE